jgi:hypothetical protein
MRARQVQRAPLGMNRGPRTPLRVPVRGLARSAIVAVRCDEAARLAPFGKAFVTFERPFVTFEKASWTFKYSK